MLALIIPYYKITFFKETLESLANQTDRRFKVYIGDDASSENPSDLLEKYKGKFDFIYHRFENNLGGISLTQQWDRCIALSGNENWIMILGDDDALAENVVEEFYKQYDIFEKKASLVRFASQIINHQKSNVSKAFSHPKWENANDSFYRKIKRFTRSSLSEYIFKKEVYLKFKFHNYPLAWHSDDMAWIEFSNNKSIYSINESVIKISVSEISLSGMNSNLELKKEASIQFYADIVLHKLSLFTKSQRLVLLMNYEVEIKKSRKVTLNEWKLLLLNYGKNFKLIPYVKLIRRIFISISTT